jgi:hypothetical protein
MVVMDVLDQGAAIRPAKPALATPPDAASMRRRPDAIITP